MTQTAHFARQFRRTYGMTPTQHRLLALSQATWRVPSGPSAFVPWGTASASSLAY